MHLSRKSIGQTYLESNQWYVHCLEMQYNDRVLHYFQ